jgi:hypothetical protein
VFPADFNDEQALGSLKACFDLMRRLGVPAEQIRAWTRANIDLAAARAIRQALKAKYDDEAWPSVAKPLQDVLREKQRSALVSYLISQHKRFPDSNALFDHFLIDVEMSACQMTSRIKQAISSVQLFIQKALMNLEEGVSLSEDQAKHWTTWMKSYRIWEANRKVFLYPENWIEPGLRDNKTPQDAVLQGIGE